MKNENEHSVWLLWMEGIMKRQGVLSRRGARLSAWTVALTALVVVVLALPLSRQMLAQTTTGSITGTLLDTQGAVVPGATVTAVNVNRNSTSTTTTDAQGHFVFAMLLPGHYTVAAEARGFKKLERQDLVV
jgi:hypothetical protein